MDDENEISEAQDEALRQVEAVLRLAVSKVGGDLQAMITDPVLTVPAVVLRQATEFALFDVLKIETIYHERKKPNRVVQVRHYIGIHHTELCAVATAGSLE